MSLSTINADVEKRTKVTMQGGSLEPTIIKQATFSKDRLYRYTLIRQWGPEPPVCFIGLNPSTADEFKDDPTIRREIGFARDWKRGGILMLNLFAWRATKPGDMFKERHLGRDIIGPENLKQHFLKHIQEQKPELVIAAWGTHANRHWHNFIQERGETITRYLKENGVHLKCLDVNKDGSPKHPLYCPAKAPIHPWGMYL